MYRHSKSRCHFLLIGRRQCSLVGMLKKFVHPAKLNVKYYRLSKKKSIHYDRSLLKTFFFLTECPIANEEQTKYVWHKIIK